MNKKLVALAIGGLLAAPQVQAQSATYVEGPRPGFYGTMFAISPGAVVLYGRVHLSMEVVSGQQPNGTNPNQYRVSTNSSRFGLRGAESLGGGTNAIFQVENSINPDASGGVLAGRDSYTGLQGSWGTFRVGRFHAPYDGINDYWGSLTTAETGILASAALWAQGGQSKQNGGFDDRLANSVRYDSPEMSGFTAAIQYGAGGANNEGTPKTTSGVTSGNVTYTNGPLRLAAGFQTNNSFRAAGLNDLAWSVTGGWQFPGVYVGAVYEKLDYDVPVNATTKANLTRNFWGLGATANLGPGQLYVEYARAQDGKGSAPTGTRIGGLAKGPDTSANQWEVSYTYPLSKRTYVYAGYIKIDNAKNASYNFGVNGFTPAVGGKPGGAILGMMHNF